MTSSSTLAQQALYKVRQRLLDLSKRNPLLNYQSKPRRSIDFVDTPVDRVYDALVLKNQSLRLGTAATELNTLQQGATLLQCCKKLARDSRAALEETGSPILYLAMGWLHWLDAHSQTEHQAPLLLIPVRLQRVHQPGTTDYHYHLHYADDDIEPNISLLEKLQTDYALTLPAWGEDDLPSDYLHAIENIVSDYTNWRISTEIRLDLFSFNKLLLYRDLDNQRWQSPLAFSEHPNLIQLLVGNTKPLRQPTHAQARQHLQAQQTEPPCVLDTDSSQQAVLSQVLLQNDNLLVEGPPGTGKSQTIANLIAGLLGEGKTVLFMAEKKAALDVVRRRLDSVGIGDFCLELHSHKTQKSQVLNDLRQRLQGDYPVASDWVQQRAELALQKKKLVAYSQLLKQTVGPLGEPLYEVFWLAEYWRGQLSQAPVAFELLQSSQLDRETYQAQLDTLNEIVEHYQALPPDLLSDWAGLQTKTILPGDEVIIASIFSALHSETQQYQTYLHDLQQHTQLYIEPTLDNLRALANLNPSDIPDLPDGFTPALAAQFLDNTLVDRLQRFAATHAQSNADAELAERVLGKVEYDAARSKALRQATQQLLKHGLASHTPQTLQYLLQQLDTHAWDQCIAEVANAQRIELGFRLHAFAQRAPAALTRLHHPEHGCMAHYDLWQQLHNELQQLQNQQAQLSEVFDFQQLPSVLELRQVVQQFANYQQQWHRFGQSAYWQLQGQLKTWLRFPELLKKADLAAQLQALLAFLEQREAFSSNPDYQHLLGAGFVGLNSDWAGLQACWTWSQGLTLLAGEAQVVTWLANDNPGQAIKAHLAMTQPDVLALIGYFEQLGLSQWSESIEVNQLQQHRRQLSQHLATIVLDKTLLDKPLLAIATALDYWGNAQRLQQEVEQDVFVQQLLEGYAGQVNLAQLQAMLVWVTHLTQLAGLPAPLLYWLLASEEGERCVVARDLLRRNQVWVEQFQQLQAQLYKYALFDVQAWFAAGDAVCDLPHIIAKTEACLTTVDAIGTYATFQHLQKAAAQQGLHRLLQAMLRGTITPTELTTQFRFSVYHSLARTQIKQHPTLTSFTRAGFEQLRQRFGELGAAHLRSTRNQIAHRIAQHPLPAGNGSGLVSTFTEKALLDRELGKKARHIPLRQLVQRAGHTLQALKPCFMMSPLSVAQYLPPGELAFDVLIVDEASQVRPEDALGAVARCQQVVVVGDRQQLAPTAFFERLEVLDESQATAIEGQDSLLESCQLHYPTRRLRWHYRSAHESLIAFSNQHFYDNQLLIFPAPQARATDVGVQYRYVKYAEYRNNVNAKEADALAAAVLQHAQTEPNLSLGVATFNREQQELLSDVVDQLCEQHPDLEAWIKRQDSSDEPFFIKNIDNVQGDERDVVLVSTVYGPDSDGRVYQRFGPLTMEDGWRRLNVVMTRARQRLQVFTSLKAKDIQVTAQSKRGLSIFKAYLQYVENGTLAQMSLNTQASNVFATVLARLLQQHGYRTVLNVGVAQFRINLAVCHPERLHEYVLGVTYDDATYHDNASIDDRDRLLPLVLAHKGWRLHHIWSVDWFKNRDGEIKRLLGVVKAAVAGR